MASEVKLLLYFCLFYGVIFTSFTCQASDTVFNGTRVCRGTSFGLGSSGDADNIYEQLKARYEHCNYVEGNLEIKYLDMPDRNYNLSFLQSIQEVTGYVLIVSNFVKYIPLNNLRIIRGSTLFHFNGDKYSLYVALNSKENSRTAGLHELRMQSLQEIMNGKVYFYNNFLLCYHNTIHWQDINPTVKPHVKYEKDVAPYERPCGECDRSCYNAHTKSSHCWGEGPGMCQHLNREICNPSCDGRCFGELPNECCHSECAAGCTGSLKTDCLACKHFKNDRECVPRCPDQMIYDPISMELIENPNGKYAFGSLCVKDCPGHLLKDRNINACIKTCREGMQAVNHTCEPCAGPCPKSCKGIEKSGFVDSKNIKHFKNCTIINGNLRILTATFDGDPHFNATPLHPSALKVLETVRQITGYLSVQSNHDDFRNLSILKNLEIIDGQEVDAAGNALSIMSTQLRSLELTKLREIRHGAVQIFVNQYLCYVSSVNFTYLFSHPKQFYRVSHNAPPAQCEFEKAVCDDQCSSFGCWGKGPNKCLQCANYKVDNSSRICISSCRQFPKLYEVAGPGKLCRHCDDECANTCSGPGPEKCDKCRNVAVIGRGSNSTGIFKCLKECPKMFYPDADRICQPCHANCEAGCTGSSREVMDGGCDTCELGIRTQDANGEVHTFCLPKDQEKCPDGYYQRQIQADHETDPLRGKRVCERCHPLCKNCNGAGNAQCIECKYYKYGIYCMEQCVVLTYPDPTTKECQSCHDECRQGCHGPTASHCEKCKNLKVYIDEELDQFNCTHECPPDKPTKVSDTHEEEGNILCAGDEHPKVQAMKLEKDDEDRRKAAIIGGSTAGVILILAILLVIFGYHWRQRARSQEKTAILTARMTGYDDEPVTPTNAKPDMASLRLIKESDLRRGGIIGSGAFGTVYKGFWLPEENVKIPVAIKVLQEGTSPNQNKELLEEARVMSSVENPHCIRILAVCMTAQMMLITQLMPLGCLLDYVRKHKENIGSKVLLNWCTQIAKGMAYLEERGIVHRDLAARNVLVQSPGQIKITDFGLAKLLDFNEEEYHAAGGKMPIKWLALECIQHRIFTHKSDVWSFGVTAWELFTYGQRPYETVRARDVPDLLEKGERLPQPNICTIDVYMIMIKCWMLDADSRPSFVELADEFAKMARDPGRYLVIAGDRLMRLPSHSYDKHDLARSLSVANEGNEEVVEADDYLQPQNRNSLVPTTPVSSKTPLLLPHDGATNVEMKGKESHQPPRIREKRYGHLESAAAAKQQRQQLQPPRGRGDSINSRYSSDPVKILRDDEEVFIKDPNQMDPVRNGSLGKADHHHKKNYPGTTPPQVKVQIPVDEDNYLQPKSSKPRSYMDLIDGGKDYVNDKPVFEEEEDDGSQYIKHDPVINFAENPEYFDGLPPTPNKSGPSKHGSNKNKDYYNDLANQNNLHEFKPLIIAEEPNSESAV